MLLFHGALKDLVQTFKMPFSEAKEKRARIRLGMGFKITMCNSILVSGITTTVQLGKHWRWTSWATRSTSSRTQPWPSRQQYGGGSPQWRRASPPPTMSLSGAGSPPRMTLSRSGFQGLGPQWTSSTGTSPVGKVISTPWTISSLTTSTTWTCWVWDVRKRAPMNCCPVLSKVCSTLLLRLPHLPTLELFHIGVHKSLFRKSSIRIISNYAS